MAVMEKAKNMAKNIKKIIKFFTTFIGQIVFAMIVILLLALLVYIIVTVIIKDVGKILGVDGGMESGNTSAQLFKDLASSGYSSLLNSDELVEYYAFEYAVLMDAARFMEETGTIPFEVEDKASVKLEQYTGDRKVWAYLNAEQFAGDYFSTDATAGRYQSMDNVSETIKSDRDFRESKKESLEVETGVAAEEPEEEGENKEYYNNGFINTSLFDTKHSEENLFYYTVTNEYTGQKSLIPYLEIRGGADKVRYYIEYRDPLGIGDLGNVEELGVKFNFGDTGWVQRSRFEGGDNSENYLGLQYSYSFILNHLYPASICSELNANNIAAYDEKDANYGKGEDKIDLYKEYSESLYYRTGGGGTDHKIPLKILLDRFMPNAVLMSSWQILSQDDENDKTAENLVDEIMKVYSEACLADETASGDKLLVKDVYTVSANVDENTKAMSLIDTILLQEVLQEKYLDGKKTNDLYNSYEALFDSRILDPNYKPSANSNVAGTQVNIPTQLFEGGFSGDVIDDIKLVLTHFSNTNNIGLSQNTFEQLVRDAEKVIDPKEQVSKSTEDNRIEDGEYIIYTPKSNGKYLAECKVLSNNDEFRKHYGLSSDENLTGNNKQKIIDEKNHKHNDYPYTAPEDMKQCFVPFMKVAFTHKDGLRATAIIISYNGNYYGYVVKGREIDDYSLLSNKNTFAFFESRDMRCTTARHWKFASGASVSGVEEESEEKWVVEDAFEGASISIDDLTVRISYTSIESPDTMQYAYFHFSFEQWCDYFGLTDEECQQLLVSCTTSQVAANGGDIHNAILAPGSFAIVRTPKDPLSSDYTDLLELPTDASISTEVLGQYEYKDGVGKSGGEVIRTEKAYINLKELGFESGDTITFSDSFGLKSSISSSMDRNKLEKLLYVKLYIGDSFEFSDVYDSGIVDAAYHNADTLQIEYEGKMVTSADVNIDEYSVVMPVRRLIIPITQEFWDNSMRFYLVKGAKTWSGIKHFKNKISIVGEFSDRNNWIYLINSNPYCKGIDEYKCKKTVNWRCELFAPIFAGKDNANTSARETDIQLILAEWLEASEQGIQAADYYIRDLYALINYSKGIKAENGDGIAGDGYDVKPIYKEDGTPYVNPSSYSFLYIPDEILLFDETSAEMAFFEDRLVSTTDDRIDQKIENKLRSKAETFTWQIVDYALYEECQNDDGTANVYSLWMFGDQLSRTLYALAANSSKEESDKVMSGWGGYASGMHPAADLYGRNQSSKIYNEVFDANGNAIITSTYNNGKVTLHNTNGTLGDDANFDDNEKVIALDTDGNGLYFFNTKVHLILGGKDYEFNGTVAAVYGYELYRQTLIYKSPEKAEAHIKEQLLKEMKWTEVRAVAPGIVIKIKGDARSGFYVKIQHAYGVTTGYMHMKRFPLVQLGQYVGAGTLLGYEGTTGNSGTYHVHFTVNDGENPVLYLYPFFTPFYYNEKAEEVDYALDSEYMSLSRTVFPYGQVLGPNLNLPKNEEDSENRLQGLLNGEGKFPSGDNYPTAEADENNMVKIKNYVPYRALIKDSKLLYNEDNDPEGLLVDYSKLPIANNSLGKVKYNGDMLKTNPDYFDEEFQRAVADNEHKIAGTKEKLILEKLNQNATI